jgi:hypothetical protein
VGYGFGYLGMVSKESTLTAMGEGIRQWKSDSNGEKVGRR